MCFMMNYGELQGYFILSFKGKKFKIDMQKLYLILNKLGHLGNKFNNNKELRACLREKCLLIEEFLEFVSHN